MVVSILNTSYNFFANATLTKFTLEMQLAILFYISDIALVKNFVYLLLEHKLKDVRCRKIQANLKPFPPP